jgi:hypothetical protein
MAKGQSGSCGRVASSAATTNAALLSSVPVDIYHISATNTTASLKYLKLYNKKSAPVVGTDVPTMAIALQPTNVLTQIPIDLGLYFNQGLAIAITGAAADADATAVAAGDVVGLNILYT